jgi:hypothetical protein
MAVTLCRFPVAGALRARKNWRRCRFGCLSSTSATQPNPSLPPSPAPVPPSQTHPFPRHQHQCHPAKPIPSPVTSTSATQQNPSTSPVTHQCHPAEPIHFPRHRPQPGLKCFPSNALEPVPGSVAVTQPILSCTPRRQAVSCDRVAIFPPRPGWGGIVPDMSPRSGLSCGTPQYSRGSRPVLREGRPAGTEELYATCAGAGWVARDPGSEKPPLWVGLNVNSANDGLLSHMSE